MDPVTIALGIANFAAPKLAKWIFGDDGEKVATQVLDVAKSVTGKDDAQDAAAVLKANPELLIEFQRQTQAMEVRLLEEETKRLESVNATMRTEYGSDDKYVKRWRPTFGYAMAATWSLQILGSMFGIIYAIVAVPTEAAVILTAIGEANAATVPMWAVALSVIGVSVWKRSEDKKTAAGQPGGLGIIGALASRIAGGAGV